MQNQAFRAALNNAAFRQQLLNSDAARSALQHGAAE
jgi:hypothetical protein